MGRQTYSPNKSKCLLARLSRISTFPQVVLFLSCCLLPFSAFQVKQIIHITKNALEDDENRMNNLLLHGTTTFVAKFGSDNRALDTTCLQSKQIISKFQSQIQEMQLLCYFQEPLLPSARQLLPLLRIYSLTEGLLLGPS